MISKDFRHIEQPQPDVLVQIDPLSSTTVCAILALDWWLTLFESNQGGEAVLLTLGEPMVDSGEEILEGVPEGEGIVSRFGIELLKLCPNFCDVGLCE